MPAACPPPGDGKKKPRRLSAILPRKGVDFDCSGAAPFDMDSISKFTLKGVVITKRKSPGLPIVRKQSRVDRSIHPQEKCIFFRSRNVPASTHEPSLIL